MNMVLTGIRQAIWDYVRCARRQPAEFFVFLLLHFLAFGTYYYGMVYLLEEIHGNSSGFVRMLHVVLASWIFIGFLANAQLIRIRSSTIKNRLLIPPPPETESAHANGFRNGDVDKNPSDDETFSYRGNGKEGNLTDDLKHLAQQFTNRPYNSDTAWHICATCETFVPPRSWHCQICDTCVLRRDHHCIFVMKCIGEDNQCNFLGLLFYLMVGTTYCSILSFIHGVYFQDVPSWMWILKAMVSFYTIFFDFSFYNIIVCINFVGCMAAAGVFAYYIWLALRGQTSADKARKITRSSPNGPMYSYNNLKDFLGPNPVLRIVWPFHKVVVNSYSSHVEGLRCTTKDL